MAEEAPKSVISKTEAWMSSIASLGALLTAYVSHIEGAATWVALGLCVLNSDKRNALSFVLPFR